MTTDHTDTTRFGATTARLWPLVPAATAAIVLMLTAAVILGGSFQTRRGPDDAAADAGFARDMQTHHAQAVEMSMLAYRISADPEIAAIGYDIALTQQAQIGTMAEWLAQWHLPPTGGRPAMAWMRHTTARGEPMSMTPADGLMPGMATPNELARLRTASGRDFDILYCELMIRHHTGGIAMVDGLLRQGERPEVRKLAEAMMTGQQNEITVFDTILARLDAARRSPNAPG
jgi:uncharacterized protein (DUF305 family)